MFRKDIADNTAFQALLTGLENGEHFEVDYASPSTGVLRVGRGASAWSSEGVFASPFAPPVAEGDIYIAAPDGSLLSLDFAGTLADLDGFVGR